MKKKIIFTAIAFLSLLGSYAQAPSGFTKGSVTLSDGSILTGYVKDNMKKDAAITYADDNGKNKKRFDGSTINEVTAENNTYLCIKGDFFKAVCTGKISFLQKASNASAKPSYNGSEAIFISGTPGKIGDYFSYANHELTLLNNKSVSGFISTLNSCAAAAEKAKAAGGNIAALADAVTIYNSYQ